MTTKASATRQENALKLTIEQVAALFGVSTMTVYNWRQGTPRRAALKPCTPEGDRFPRFLVADLRRYAKEHDLEFANDPSYIVKSHARLKPGPKPKLAEASKSSEAAKKKPRH